ncbi:ABC transporter substrate-binding protein [Clostridium cylindrosporum]|uniref:ABC-type sugar transport system, periplasmic component n=1 Tax=Clostridium cylindrosporum DSM 605 TaxID=1121307 RepID=A0A0J8DCW9_CLOCY|nr:sugar ABC transporter substrate-binding protein [Clostridium cylindrosporum]KMT22098.1 ABC-type sugar transport system, periplasmic component [Clostridium cylindrosporum DSM 605]
MKRFSKILATMLILVVTIAAFASCSKSDNKSKSTSSAKEITVWLPPIGPNDKPVWEPIFKKFEKENNCKIKLEIIPWQNYPEKYATAIQAGTGPDVGYMYAEMYPQFIKMGAVEDLTKRFTDEDFKNYTYLDASKMMGGMYGFPIEAANPGVLYFNEDIVKATGEAAILAKLKKHEPITWDEFLTVAKKATKDINGDGKVDQWGFAQGWGATFFGDLNWNWYNYLWQAGGDIYTEDLKGVKFNDAAGVKAAKFLYDMKNTYKIIPSDAMSKTNEDMLKTVFGPGKAAFAIGLSSKASELFDKEFKNLKYDFTISMKDKKAATFASVDQLTLMSAAKDKDLSFKLMKHMLSAESMTAFHKYNPRAPISKDEPYQGDPKFKEMIEKDKGIYRPLVVGPNGVEIYEYLWKELQKTMNGEKSPEAALNDAAKYANDLISKNSK